MRCYLLAFCALILFLTSLPGCKSRDTSAPAGSASIRRIDDPAAGHPRLLLTGQRIDSLRQQLSGTHAWLWNRYLQDLPQMVSAARSEHASEDTRYEGDLAVELAFAWLMTGSDSLLNLARSHLLKLTDPAAWETSESLVYLIGSHYLIGIGLAYDWMYGALSPQERSIVAGCLGRQAEAQYQSIVNGRVWWRNQYYQNHSHSNYCALAFAAAALYGEDKRAVKWLSECEPFFEKIFSVMPPDGSSVEGYAYAGYGAEYLLNYAVLSRDLLGRDYTGSPWMKNTASYMLHGLLPVCTAERWAMTFGDAPQRGWTSTAQHLLLLARLYRDPAAQWMGRYTVSLKESGLGSHGWMMLINYDSAVPEADPAGFETFKLFPEVGQAMLRSSWTDSAATLIGFKCGPVMSLSQAKTATFDWGTGHAEPDAGAFQLFSHGQFLAAGALYTGYERSLDHNVMLFKGHGQLGEEMPSLASVEALKFGHYPHLDESVSNPRFDLVTGDVCSAYHPALGLKRYLRRMLFLKPDILLVVDDFQLEDKGMLYQFPSPGLKTSGGLTHNSSGQVSGTDGEAWARFDGIPGMYRIYVCYLDNRPGQADYTLEVDGAALHNWKSNNSDTDDNLLEVSPAVELKKGSRITFRGSNLPAEFRLTKIAAFSESVSLPPVAVWQLQLDPSAALSQSSAGVTASLGGAALDVLPLLPAGSRTGFHRQPAAGVETEPFNYPAFWRLTIEPRMDSPQMLMLTILYSRSRQTAQLKEVSASAATDGSLEISFIREGRRTRVTWDMAANKVDIKE
jgi:hypothetical protein